MGKSCSCRAPGFSCSAPLLGDVQPPATPAPGNPLCSSGLSWHLHAHCNTDVHPHEYTLHILMCTHLHAHWNTDMHPREYTLHILMCTYLNAHCNTDVHAREYTLHILMCTHMTTPAYADVYSREYTLHMLTCTHMSTHCTYWCTRACMYIAHTDVHPNECTVHTNNKKPNL